MCCANGNLITFVHINRIRLFYQQCNGKTHSNQWTTINYAANPQISAEGNVTQSFTCKRSRSSPMMAALLQSMTSENGNTQSLLNTTGIHAASNTSKNLQQQYHQHSLSSALKLSS